MKILILGIISSLLTGIVSLERIQEDPAAKEILTATSQKFKSLDATQADFKMIIEVPEQEPVVENGQVFLKGEKFKITFEDQEIICDNKSIWRHLKSMNEVQINDYEPSGDEITPSKIFTIYENDFDYLFISEEKYGDYLCNVIDLTPVDKNKSYFKVRIFIDKDEHVIRKARIFDKNGSRYNYEISSIVLNPELDDSFFEFNEADYPDVVVEDLRF